MLVFSIISFKCRMQKYIYFFSIIIGYVEIVLQPFFYVLMKHAFNAIMVCLCCQFPVLTKKYEDFWTEFSLTLKPTQGISKRVQLSMYKRTIFMMLILIIFFRYQAIHLNSYFPLHSHPSSYNTDLASLTQRNIVPCQQREATQSCFSSSNPFVWRVVIKYFSSSLFFHVHALITSNNKRTLRRKQLLNFSRIIYLFFFLVTKL